MSSESSSRITVREATLNLLRAFGITSIFGNPGSTELALFRDFPTDFRYVLGLHEAVAVGMADGYAQATHNAAFVNLHSAAGVGNAMGNIFTASRNRTPLILTAGQQARSILPFEPFLFATQATELPKPYVKWSCEPARAEDVPLAIATAYYLAMQPPRGPTFVSIPVDDWDRTTQPVTPRTLSRVARPDPALVESRGVAIDRSRAPVLVVGAAVDREGGWDEIVTLAERYQTLVWASPMSARCSFPERHPLFAGFLPPMRERIVELLKNNDLIVVLGAPVFTYHVEGFGPHVPAGSQLFQVIDEPQTAAHSPVGTTMVCSVCEAMRDLLVRPNAGVRPTVQGRLPPRRIADEATLISAAYLMQTLAGLRPADSIIVEESPSTRPVMQDYLPIERPNSFHTCASGGLGHALPAAVGIALANATSGRRVIALIGDGSALYSIQSLWSAAQWRLPMTIVIVNNHRYRALDEFAAHFGVRAPVGTQLPGLDFVALARGQGVSARRVSLAAELPSAIAESLESPQPRLLDVDVSEG